MEADESAANRALPMSSAAGSSSSASSVAAPPIITGKPGFKRDGKVTFVDGCGSFVAGVVSGFCVKTLTAPLSRATILLQTQGAALTPSCATVAGSATSSRTLPYLMNIVRQEGVLSFWKGNWTSIVHKAGATGINYVGFEYTKNALFPLWTSEDNPGVAVRSLAGFLAGSFTIGLLYPLDVVRTQLACNPQAYHLETKVTKSKILDSVRTLAKQGGGYRGFLCTILCQGSNIGINFGVYETLNSNRLRDSQTRTGFWPTIVDGACAGFIASCLIYPLDLIRRRQQLGCNDNIRTIARSIVRAQGISGLYRGLVPELVKVVPAVGLNFWIYEFVRQECFDLRVNVR